MCWACKGPMQQGVLICPTCDAVSNCFTFDFFTLLGMDMVYNVDLKKLDDQYLKLQKLLHPDNYVQVSSREQLYAAQQSARINDAYETLKDDVDRALCLISMADHAAGKTSDALEGVALAPDDLELQFSLRELLQNGADAATLLKDVVKMMKTCVKKLQKDFVESDITQAKQDTMKLKFLKVLEKDIHAQMA